MLLRNNLLSNNKMKSELVIHFLKKYKKEILQWIFVIIFCQTFDFKQIAYTRESYERKLAKDYERKLAKSKKKSTKSEEEEL